VRGGSAVGIIRVVSVAVAAKDKGGYMVERGGIVLYITGGPERAEVDVGTDKKNDPAGKRDGDRNNIRDLIVPGINNNDQPAVFTRNVNILVG
jgi:hypothetical protein